MLHREQNKVPYNGKVWRGECLANSLFSSVWPKGLLIVTTNLGGFSLVNHRRFAKFAKLSAHQTFSLYGTPQKWTNLQTILF